MIEVIALIAAFATLMFTVIAFGISHGRRMSAMEIRMIDRIADAVTATASASREGERTLHDRCNVIDAKVNLNTTHITTIRNLCAERHGRHPPATDTHRVHA